LSKDLEEAGVTVETLQTEVGKGQMEIVLKPEFGINGPDNCFKFRTCVKESLTSPGREWEATFMARPIEDTIGSSGHYNHSLWKDGKDLMWDADTPSNLSEIAESWLAGLLLHAPALSALCCPTVNCWRRLHQAFTPSSISWGKENRLCMVRVKTEGADGGTWLESRLGSAAMNPYLGLAGMIAAGMDGLRKNLKLQPEFPYGSNNGPKEGQKYLPTTLDEA